MKKVKLEFNPIGWIVFFITVAIVLSFGGCRAHTFTIGEELCQLGCANVGAKMLDQYDHVCVCYFEMPHLSNDVQPRTKESNTMVQR